MFIKCTSCNHAARSQEEHLQHMKFRHFGARKLTHICAVCYKSLRQSSYERHCRHDSKHLQMLSTLLNHPYSSIVTIPSANTIQTLTPTTQSRHTSQSEAFAQRPRRQPDAFRQLLQSTCTSQIPLNSLPKNDIFVDYDAANKSITELINSCDKKWMDLLGQPKITSKLIDSVSNQHIALIRSCTEIFQQMLPSVDYDNIKSEMEALLSKRRSQYMRMKLLQKNPFFLPPDSYTFRYRETVSSGSLIIRSSNIAVVDIEKTLRMLFSNKKLCEDLLYPSMFYDSMDFEHPFSGEHTKQLFEVCKFEITSLILM